MKTYTALLVSFSLLLLSSCAALHNVSIKKRHYENGYYVHYSHPRATAPSASVTTGNAAPASVSSMEKTTRVEQENPREEPALATQNVAAKNNSGNLPGNKTAVPVKKKPAHVMQVFHPAKPFHAIKGNSDVDTDDALVLVLLIILAIILPPLAVLLVDGASKRFVIDLIFWLLGFVFIAIPGFIIGLGIFALIAIIYALLIVLDVI